MAVTSTSQGSQTATINTEHILATSTTPHAFMVTVDCTAMVSGDVLTLRLYRKVITGGAFVLFETSTLTGAQAVDAITLGPMPSSIEVKATLQQTAGTGRAYPWNLERVS